MRETQVRELMAEAVAGPPPDTIDVEEAIRRGRTLRARVRLRRSAGVTAAALTLTAAGLFVTNVGAADPLSGYSRPASIPTYSGPAAVPAAQWSRAIADLLPGTVVASYPGQLSTEGGRGQLSATFRLERGGRTSLVRVDLWSGGGGNDGNCALGMRNCSKVVASPQVPGARLQTYDLDQTYAHEDGHVAAIMWGMYRDIRVGTGPDNLRATVELHVTAVAADLGPGPDGWTIGGGIAATPVLSRSEILALAQTVPLPQGLPDSATPQP